MLNTNAHIKSQLLFDCAYEKQLLVNNEIQETTMYYNLRAQNIFNIDDFITNQLKKLILKEI